MPIAPLMFVDAMRTAMALLSILISTPLAAQTSPAPRKPASVSDYGGEDLDGVASINPSIHLSRDSGEVPCVIQCSAVGTTATGVTRPFSQLWYEWDFGDPKGTEVFKHPVTGAEVNANCDQGGPNATYIYRKPGTYSITLKVSSRNLAGKIIRASHKQKVTVSAYSGSILYVDPEHGNDANDGRRESKAKQSWAAMTTWLADGRDRGVFLKRGTTMVQTSSLRITDSHWRIEAYGDGKAPILAATAELKGANQVWIWANHKERFDGVISGIHVQGNGHPRNGINAYSSLKGSLRDIALIDCRFDGAASHLVSFSGKREERITSWNCDYDHGTTSKGHCLFADLDYDRVQQMEFLSVVGGSMIGGAGNQILDHHIYPSGWRRFDLFRWIDFGPSVSSNFCINENCPSFKGGGYNNEYWLVDGCNITGTHNGIDGGAGNGTWQEGMHDHAIIQQCYIHDLGANGGQSNGILGDNFANICIRDNRFHNNRNDISIRSPAAKIKEYRNQYD